MFKIILAISGIFIIFVVLIFMMPKKERQVCFNNNCFVVEVAASDKDREKGLMNVEKLDENRGMLFIFNSEGYWPFWMKNTLIPLDIIWINNDKEAVFIKNNVLPCQNSQCDSYRSDSLAKYVLEINGGIAEKLGVEIGSIFEFKGIELTNKQD